MILSFGSKETKKVWKGERAQGLPNEIQEIARRKLRMLNSAQNLQDLKVPPSNSLEKLRGKWKGWLSIRINDQWRIVFIWQNGHSLEVTITDYH